jgi:hypothetical protein
MEHIWSREDVVRVRCESCGSTGPVAKSVVAAEFLAVICEWDGPTSMCPVCKTLREKACSISKTVKKTKPIRKE